MDKNELYLKLSQKSGLETDACKRVIDAFEDVLSEELSISDDTGALFDNLYKLISFFKGD